mgnify:CR=1 FL=1
MSGITAAQARSDYRRAIADHGEAMIVRRQPSTDVEVTGIRLVGQQNVEMPGTRQSSVRKFLVIADDLAGIAPLQPNRDRLIWAGKTLVIIEVDDTTRRVAGELIAYELTTVGA